MFVRVQAGRNDGLLLHSVDVVSQWIGLPCVFLLCLVVHKHVYVAPRAEFW